MWRGWSWEGLEPEGNSQTVGHTVRQTLTGERTYLNYRMFISHSQLLIFRKLSLFELLNYDSFMNLLYEDILEFLYFDVSKTIKKFPYSQMLFIEMNNFRELHVRTILKEDRSILLSIIIYFCLEIANNNINLLIAGHLNPVSFLAMQKAHLTGVAEHFHKLFNTPLP